MRLQAGKSEVKIQIEGGEVGEENDIQVCRYELYLSHRVVTAFSASTELAGYPSIPSA